MDADGTNLTQLTTEQAGDSNPHWSADGSKIVLHSDRSGNNDIWIMDSDGSSPTQITTNTMNDRRPSLSPDGLSVVFQSNRSGNEEIWIYNLQ